MENNFENPFHGDSQVGQAVLEPTRRSSPRTPPFPYSSLPFASSNAKSPTPSPSPVVIPPGHNIVAPTLTEPVWETVQRDLSRILSNLKLVLFPNPHREDPGKALRDWDLWGPFFFVIFLGLTLSWSASIKKVSTIPSEMANLEWDSDHLCRLFSSPKFLLFHLHCLESVQSFLHWTSSSWYVDFHIFADPSFHHLFWEEKHTQKICNLHSCK